MWAEHGSRETEQRVIGNAEQPQLFITRSTKLESSVFLVFDKYVSECASVRVRVCECF